MRKKELIPLAKLIAEDNRFKKALKREFPKLAKLIQELIKRSPETELSQSLEIQLRRIRKTISFQHGIQFGTLFVEIEKDKD